ncbi:MAG: hypothetical protein ACLPVI_08125, partial [Dehalococcoidales bacterium]
MAKGWSLVWIPEMVGAAHPTILVGTTASKERTFRTLFSFIKNDVINDWIPISIGMDTENGLCSPYSTKNP